MNGRWTARSLAAVWLAAAVTGTHLAAAVAPPAPSHTRIVGLRIGFGGHYKVGCWTPVEVTLEGGPERETGAVELTVADGDGVPTRVRTAPSSDVTTAAGRRSTSTLYAKFGRTSADLTVRFLADGQPRAERTYRPGHALDDEHPLEALPSTDELILTVGPAIGIDAAVAQPVAGRGYRTQVVGLADIAQLPPRWYGYEGVDTLVLLTSRSDLGRQLGGDRARAEALAQWVRWGGQLVMFVAAAAPTVLAPPSPLGDLIPGRFDRMVALAQMRALETFCDASAPIEWPPGMARLEVPLLRGVTGRIEAYEGNRPDDLPLVIRAPIALGEVVLVLVDPDQPPLKDWRGRTEFLRRVLRPEVPSTDPTSAGPSGPVITPGYTDLTGQLRDAMDRFHGVWPVPFALVAGLVLVYIVLIGPVDYFLVRRWFRRTQWAWLTFPVWVAVFAGGGYALASWMKGNQLRVNQVELVDLDVASGFVRGTMWAHLFSPQSDAYDFAFQPRLPGTLEPRQPQVLLSWMGLPGTALGGMQAGAAGPSTGMRAYTFAPELDRLESVPIQVWSTKSILARWTSRTQVPLEAQLVEGVDGTLSGALVNALGVDLAECHLLYDRWVYRIPALPHGTTQLIGEALEPRYVRTWLQRDGPYDPTATDLTAILRMMMFHAAAGGTEYTHLLHRYQGFCDLSHLLTTGRAILLAHGRPPGSQLLRDRQPMVGPHDRQWVVYRFVIPVTPPR